MNRGDLTRIRELFRRALALKPDARAAFLEAECDEPGLREEILALLAQHEGLDEEFLEPSPTVTRAMRELIASAGEPDAETDPLIGQRIGPFHIKTRIAVGGMAVVYEAVQQQPHRVVALKVMRQNVTSASALRRFEFEAQILARMRHPHIAQIYQAGTARVGGVTVPYFAMEYVVGARTLTEYAQARKLTIRQRLELFAKVCDGVHHGHTRGVIHRDLKPANILIDARGEPKIIDFGVARATDSDLALTTQQTHVGQLVGTMQYMSPEQCDADPHNIDTRSDVYALGVVLYELLTGKLPYDAGRHTIYQVTQIIKEKPPHPISRIDPRLRGDIETIVHKALEKDRDRRYASAAELAADIRRFLAGEPITARKPSPWYLLSRYARRHQAVFAGVAAVFLVLVAAVIVAGSLAAWARHEQHRAELARQAAETQAALAQLGLAQARLKEHDPGSARVALDAVPQPLRGWVWRHLYHVRLDQSIQVIRLRFAQAQRETSCTLSADGRWVAFRDAVGDAQYLCMIFQVTGAAESRPLVETLRLGVGNSGSIALSGDGSWLATSLHDGRRHHALVLWNVHGPPDRRFVGAWRVPEGQSIVSLAFLRRRESSAAFPADPGELLAVGEGVHGRILLVRLRELIARPRPTTRPGAPDPDAIRRAPLLPVHATLTGLTRDMWLSVSPSGRWLAAASREHVAAIWDIDEVRRGGGKGTYAPAALMIGHRDHVRALAFSPDERILASSSIDQTIRLWDLSPLHTAARSTAQPLRLRCVGILTGHRGPVLSLAYAPDGRRLYSASSDGTLRIWDVRPAARITDIRARHRQQTTDYRLLRTLYGHSGSVLAVVALRNGLVATAGEDGTLRLWLPTRDPLPHTAPHYSSVKKAVWTPDGRFLITADSYYAICVWDAQSLAPVAREFTQRWGEPCDLKVWPAERLGEHWVVVAAGTEYYPGIGTTRTGVMLYRLSPDGRLRRVDDWTPPDPQATGGFACVALSRDRRRVAASTARGGIHVWTLRSRGRERTKLAEHVQLDTEQTSGWQVPVFLDDAGRWLLTADASTHDDSSTPYALHLWDLEQRRRVRSWDAHHDRIEALTLSPDGRRVATGSSDATVRLWRIVWTAGRPELVPDGEPLPYTSPVTALAFHPRDPDRLFGGTFTSRVLVWNLKQRTLVAALMAGLGPIRDLTFCRPDGDRLAAAATGDEGAGNVAWILEAARPSSRALWARARTTRALELIDALFWNPGIRSIGQYRQRLLEIADDPAADPLTRQAAAAAAGHVEYWLPHPQWYRLRYEHVLRDLAPVDEVQIRDALDWARIAASLCPEEYGPDLDALRRRLATTAQAPTAPDEP